MDNSRSPAWKSCLGVGCAIVVAIGLIGGAFVALNWTTISDGFSKATSTFSGLLDVQAAVRAHTGAREVKVHAASNSGVEGSTLRIEILGGGFLGDTDPAAPGAREKALLVAVVARDALPPGTTYERYEIVHTSQLSVGVTVSSSQRHVFTPDQLPAAAPR